MEEKHELLDLKSDWVFKRIFGKEGNEDILANLITAITNEKIDRIVLKNTELLKDREEQKLSRLDVRAEINDDTIVVIEMQNQNEHNLLERNIQYITKLYSEQLKNGQDYKEAKNVILINILNFDYFKINSPYSEIGFNSIEYPREMYVKLYEKEEKIKSNKLRIFSLELKKYLKLDHKEEPKDLDLWAWLFSKKEEVVKMALSEGAQAIQRAYEQLEYLSQDEQAREEYDNYIQSKIDMQMKLDYAEEKGISKGLSQGLSQGLSRGRKEGGIKYGERKQKIKIVKNMLKSKLSIETIMDITGATKKEIEEIGKM